MTWRRNRPLYIGLALVGVLAGLLLSALVVPDVYSELVANIERVRAVKGLDLSERGPTLEELAWEAGWRSLCSPAEAEMHISMPSSNRVLQFGALASMDDGDYATAQALLQRLADQGLADDEPNALAYQAALDMDWVEAAQAYEPQATPRHERWWGTVFYLAAQRLMFEGDLDRAAELYRRADAAYGVHGPYLGLGLVECLVQRGRSLEAWDAYRRALVVMLPDEALGHLARFGELRLEGLRAWHELDPENERAAHWLAFYEGEALGKTVDSEALEGEPIPQVSLELDTGDGRMLIGFDYRVEDLETGPFMEVDFYLREGQGEQSRYRQVRQTVLNQAPNGAFAWDVVPDGVRPVGWHKFLYDRNLAAIQYRDLSRQVRWLCMNGGAIQEAFGLQSKLTTVRLEAPVYVQGGHAYVSDEGSLAHGRRWFGVDGTTYPYSYLVGGHLQNEVQSMVGVWIPDAGVEAVAVWLFSAKIGQACTRNVYLFSVPNLKQAQESATQPGGLSRLQRVCEERVVGVH
jgi:tetratricopeptide (TPR) repeat protein